MRRRRDSMIYYNNYRSITIDENGFGAGDGLGDGYGGTEYGNGNGRGEELNDDALIHTGDGYADSVIISLYLDEAVGATP